MNPNLRSTSILALLALVVGCGGTPEPAPQGPSPQQPEVRQPPPPAQPPERAFFVHVALRCRDDGFQPFPPGSAQSIADAVRSRGWTSVSAGEQSQLDAIAESSGGDPLPALAQKAPPGTRWLLVGTSELEPTAQVGPFPTWKSRLRIVVYDVPGRKTVFDETVEGNGSANDDRQASIDSDQMAGREMASRLAGFLPAVGGP